MPSDGSRQMEEISELQRRLSEAQFSDEGEERVTLQVLKELARHTIDVDVLKVTGVGITVGRLRKHTNEQIKTSALKLVKTWKGAVSVDITPNTDRPPVVVSPRHVTEEEFKTGDAVRDKIRKLLCDALVNLETESDRMFVSMQIEDGLFHRFGNTQKEYRNQYRNIAFNLKDKTNEDFADNVCRGIINPIELANMDSTEMASDKMKASRADRQHSKVESVRTDLNRGLGATDMFKCGRCKKSKATFYQMQTRSADEPMTTFITCVHCGNRWRM